MPIIIRRAQLQDIYDLLTLSDLPSLQPTLSVPRRVASNITVHQHGYCRVHVHPKRFPLAYTANWQVCMLCSPADVPRVSLTWQARASSPRMPDMCACVWIQERVIVNEDEYVVLNKPPGVQVTPTVDNLLECCLTLGAKVLAAHSALRFQN
jgi:23S rRNA-/tRNA-specific pseudouridylate synthase